MLGAIAGDIIGSVYEVWRIKTTEFPLFKRRSRFTDDTVLTVAVAWAILQDEDYAVALRKFGRRYPLAGYGARFTLWLLTNMGPYNSWGNGSAMRVSPVGFAFDTIEEVLAQAEKSASVTHNHPEGIKGAQATALALFLCRKGAAKNEIKQEITQRFNYDLSLSVDEIRPEYRFDPSCQGTVPQAITCFLESENFEDAVRKAISLGGDSDTIGCVTGGIAQAYYKEIPKHIISKVRQRLPEEFLRIIDEFNTLYLLQKL
ncbi:MAG: ADP-ribosylglycohydrolase family protein [Planctomycetota bacterium]|jgi:ADP-ribosylglycohydrolase